MIGTPITMNGMNRGAKKKYTCPENSTSTWPPTSIVAAAMRPPSMSAPPSPMKIFAGCTLWGRKPRQMPAVISAISGLGLSGPMTATSAVASSWP